MDKKLLKHVREGEIEYRPNNMFNLFNNVLFLWDKNGNSIPLSDGDYSALAAYLTECLKKYKGERHD